MAVLAANLATLRQEIYRRWPNHQKRRDGWIGDVRHQRRKSDHNPDVRGVVHAIDVDVNGIEPNALVRRAIRHPSTEYVIFNRTIWSRVRDFQPRRYTGTDPHTGHVHISGRHGSTHENNRSVWGVAATSAVKPAKPAPRAPAGAPLPVQPGKPGSRSLRLTRPPMHGYDVLFVQRFIGAKQCGVADGFYGPQTEAGVRWYQHMRGIKATGVCDAATFREMGVKA
ncbi:peptidoglycan-binding protein [Micromonospora sp. NPDC005806]|uniref:peptidoglycan-binding domain-containing protein n=1 Tax=Micromonospora sp. NPDC005806 TaxID=3364234 RepID=UPI0036894F20